MEEAINNSKIIEIEYKKAKISKRIFAFIMDFIFLFFLSSLLFGFLSFINTNLAYFKDSINKRDELLISINLLTKDKKDNIEAIKESDLMFVEKKDKLKEIIDNFYINTDFFMDDNFEFNYLPYDNYLKKAEDFKINDEIAFKVNKENRIYEEIIENELYYETYFNFYYDEIINTLKGYLIYNDTYLNTHKIVIISNLVFFFISTILSYLTFFLLIPLIFKKGRQTLGMNIFKISLIYVDGFKVQNKTFIFKFLFSMFIEFYLSIFTFLIPFIISSLMYLISSRNQTLSEYLFSSYMIDVETSIIYENYEEYIENKLV